MQTLEIPRSKLRPYHMAPGEEQICLLGHVLRAAGLPKDADHYTPNVGGVLPWELRQFYDMTGGYASGFRDDVFDGVLRRFDDGDERGALKALERLGWAVTIKEDA
jgi:hypothetical protein